MVEFPILLPVPLLLTARQASAVLAISERTLFRLVRSQAIPALHVGTALRFSPDDLRAYVHSLRAAATATEGGGQ